MEKTAEEYLRLVCDKLELPWIIQAEFCVADIINEYIYNVWKNKHLSIKDKIKYHDFILVESDFSIQEIEPYLFKINDKFIKCEVIYDSWIYENEFIGCYFVEPREKTVIEYVKVGE